MFNTAKIRKFGGFIGVENPFIAFISIPEVFRYL
jgi:hypothetical protein